jgi:hypothetical protein
MNGSAISRWCKGLRFAPTSHLVSHANKITTAGQTAVFDVQMITFSTLRTHGDMQGNA